jgi:phage-related minor tail protein
MGTSDSSLGEAVLELGADDSQLNSDLEGARARVVGTLSMLSSIGGAILTGLLTMIASVSVAIGLAIFNAGTTLDAAYDNIAVRTGSTGEQLNSLQDDFNAVFSSVPTDATTASNVVSLLNSRLGVTGESLQGIAIPLLEVSRITGGDATTNTELFTWVMGDWSVSNEDATGTLDMLFTASQETGVGMDQLMTQIVQYGAPMREFGFSIEDSVALFARWEQQGVNTETVMSGMRIAASNFASANVPLREGLLSTFEAIQNAASEQEALNLGMETFGARAGPDMVAAIREGRFEIDDLVDALADSQNAIMDTSAATMDWGEQWTIFQNRMTVALGPAGQSVMSAASSIMDAIASAFERPDVQAAISSVSEWIGNLASRIAEAMPGIIDNIFGFFDWLRNNRGVVVAVLAAMGVAIGAFLYSSAAAAITAAGGFGVLWAAVWPVLAVMAAVAAIAYLVYEAWTNNWGGIRDTLTSWWAAAQVIFTNIITWFQVNIPLAIQTVTGWWNSLISAMQAVQLFIQTYIVPVFTALGLLLSGDIGGAIAVLAGYWNDILLPAIQAVIAAISERLQPIFQAIADFIDQYVSPIFRTFGGWISDHLVPAFQAVANVIQDIIDWLDRIGEAIANIDWGILEPGSPTPFEWGLRGIRKQLVRLNKMDLPSLATNLSLVPDQTTLGAIAGSGSSQASNSRSWQFTNYVTNAGVDADELARINRREELLYGI